MASIGVAHNVILRDPKQPAEFVGHFPRGSAFLAPTKRLKTVFQRKYLVAKMGISIECLKLLRGHLITVSMSPSDRKPRGRSRSRRPTKPSHRGNR